MTRYLRIPLLTRQDSLTGKLNKALDDKKRLAEERREQLVVAANLQGRLGLVDEFDSLQTERVENAARRFSTVDDSHRLQTLIFSD